MDIELESTGWWHAVHEKNSLCLRVPRNKALKGALKALTEQQGPQLLIAKLPGK